MRVSDDIFQLIKSLTKSEKGYFKKYASTFVTTGERNYMKLFDAIDRFAGKENTYDEEKLKRQLDENLIKQLSVLKNYLFSLIMKSMVWFHTDKHVESKARRMLEEYDILFSKILYKQCAAQLKKIRKLAEEYELYAVLMDVISREKTLARTGKDMKKFDEISKQGDLNLLEIVKVMENSAQFSILSSKIMPIITKYANTMPKTSEELKELNDIFDNPLLRDEQTELSFHTRTLFYNFKIQHSILINDKENMHRFTVKNVKYMEQNIHKLNGNLWNYIVAVYNLGVSTLRMRAYNDMEAVIEKFYGIEKNYSEFITDNNRAYIFHFGCVMKFGFYLDTCSIENLKQVCSEVELNFDLFSPVLSGYFQIILMYLTAYANFIIGDYILSLKWLSKISNLPRTPQSEDYQGYARILRLLIDFEREDYESLEYTMKSAYHFFASRRNATKFEKLVLNYLRRTFRIHTTDELAEVLEELLIALNKLKENPEEGRVFENIDLISWVKSKLEKKPMSEIKVEEIKKKQDKPA